MVRKIVGWKSNTDNGLIASLMRLAGYKYILEYDDESWEYGRQQDVDAFVSSYDSGEK